MKKLSAAVLLVAAMAGTASAGWTHKVSVFAPVVKSSTTAVANVRIEAAPDFRLNLDYPTRVTITAPEGVTIEKSKLTARDAMALDKNAAQFGIVLSAAEKGAKVVRAEIQFSVCNGNGCAPKTEAIEFEVQAE